MSRIQNILDKAERDGGLRRMHGVVEALVPPLPPPLPPLEHATVGPPLGAAETIGAGTITAVVPRVLTGARLDPRLIPALPSDASTVEQYRALRTRIFHADNGTTVNVVLVTSPGRTEG